MHSYFMTQTRISREGGKKIARILSDSRSNKSKSYQMTYYIVGDAHFLPHSSGIAKVCCHPYLENKTALHSRTTIMKYFLGMKYMRNLAGNH